MFEKQTYLNGAEITMQLCNINPFMRYAELQPSVMSSAPFKCAYDHRIFYILDGEATLVFTDRQLELASDTLVFFKSGIPYYFDGKVKVIVIDLDLCRESSEKRRPLHVVLPETFDSSGILEEDLPEGVDDVIIVTGAYEIKPRLEECISAFRSPTEYSDAMTSAILKEIFCYAVQNANDKTKRPPEIIGRTEEYIRSNYDKDLSNEIIASEFGYHPFYLNRIFKKHTGQTLHKALIGERIKIAKMLLRNTSLSVEEISEESGFGDRTSFCTTFKKTVGISPSEYRSKKRA